MQGLSSALLRQLRKRLSRDIHFDLASEQHVCEVQQWLAQATAESGALSTADVLALYSSRSDWAEQILVTTQQTTQSP